ncbi:type VI secretion ATPase, ClpV1 family [Salmonella enterica subsp. enterica serovar Infantis str. SARB27]|uniref:Type VI secretion system ATPase TssH n=2 Tax=Salmonella infantis TaxID=595 RepID=A0A5Y7ANA3_SALIN|nr:type VI secretion system ATPase TssH [Salmonella enterica]ECK9504130.1 type VI secretion system ATPase TssH [Salmonella enterica subsp. enterica serovar Infantis str. CFSAN000522]EHB41251.1 type VI secretion ATPase, ClpV1 family [Salmonella enterica subsp. enterica serovar Infantis str. SARB27]QCV24246.1 type VI secretion system ATPase TssH [Salmonella enterica subsp. enterica serovar Infantis]QCV28725.1 type VI secretion system ATPase TssH [Salmonella enterica subsp. enterica serovar Infant
MIQIDLATLVKRLAPFAKQALEAAASECMSQQAAEITVSHVLIQMLAIPRSDFRVIAERAEIGADDLRQALTVENYATARSADSYPSFSPMLVEWLKEAWLLASAEMQQTELRGGVLLLALLHSPLRYVPPAAARLLTAINRDRLQQDFTGWTKESAESVVLADGQAASATADTGDTLLGRYAKNMTDDARQGRLDPVLCRDNEIDLMIDILCRRRKNNPVVVGEAGVGKSALIEGLALRIVDGRVPDKLRDTAIMTLDLGALQAGASVKGEFEKRFKGLMAEVIQSPTPIILFIDEAHTLIGAGNQQGGLDISNLLKPALARGELKTIAATTWSEYKKYFEKDAALSRRFQLVKVSEPTAAEATIILRGLSAVYEQSHGVLIDDEALQAAATLSERYLSGRQLPDKAIDVLDTACARVAINLSSPPKQISALTTLRQQCEAEMRQLEREIRIGLRSDTTRLDDVTAQYDATLTELEELEAAWHQQQTLVQEIIALRKGLLEETDATGNDETATPETEAVGSDDESVTAPPEAEPEIPPAARLAQLTAGLDALHHTQLLVSPHVDKKQIAAVIAEWTGVPLNRLSQNEMSVITDLPQWLGDTIKGQDLAIKHLHKHLLTARADLRRPGRPLGAFLLAGPSGVGKTETVLQLAELLYGGRQYLTTINMSEFQEKHTVSRLIGSPPGYVGYGEGGVLTEAIRQKPYSVVLLDEVEKAHPDVLNLFYQAFDKGEMADGEGRLIDCKNIVFFLTSNLGYQVIVEHADNPETMQEALYPVLADFFKPALLARMEVVPYLPLSKETLAVIIAGKLARLDNVLRSRFGAEVVIEPEVTDEIMQRVTRAENGARMLESVIDGEMLPPLSLLLLQKMAASAAIARITLGVTNGAFTADVEDAPDDGQPEPDDGTTDDMQPEPDDGTTDDMQPEPETEDEAVL